MSPGTAARRGALHKTRKIRASLTSARIDPSLSKRNTEEPTQQRTRFPLGAPLPTPRSAHARTPPGAGHLPSSAESSAAPRRTPADTGGRPREPQQRRRGPRTARPHPRPRSSAPPGAAPGPAPAPHRPRPRTQRRGPAAAPAAHPSLAHRTPR